MNLPQSVRNLEIDICTEVPEMCDETLQIIMGHHSVLKINQTCNELQNALNHSRLSVMASYIPAVTSVQDMGHWYQFLFKKRNNSQGVSY